MILTTQDLVDTLRQKCDQAKERIWIVSPFIGHLKGVQQIIGGQWMKDSVDFCVITDNETGFIRQDTFDMFSQFGEVCSLKSVHAKMYIVDDWCLITSANLTATAFSRRHEVGTVLEREAVDDAVKLFCELWDKSNLIDFVREPASSVGDLHDGKNSYKPTANLPSYTITDFKFDSYSAKCEMFKKFAEEYEQLTGRVKAMKDDKFTLLQEVDFLFNYLYHEDPDKPSAKLQSAEDLTSEERKKRIIKYHALLEEHYDSKKHKWKKEDSDTVRKVLKKKAIKSLNREGVKDVANCIHSLKVYGFHLNNFLHSSNNKLKDIRDNWYLLLHTGEPNAAKIKTVNKNLRSFGNSSIQELIGWFYPDKYPLINSNSIKGMRFFGYDIK